MIFKTLLFFLLGISLSGCGMVKRGTIPWEERAKEKVVTKPAAFTTPVSSESVRTSPEPKLSRSEKKVKEALDLAFKDWKGIPYLLGGTGYNGVDCSSFMQIVYGDYFEITLPRTTREQMKEGGSVRKKSIKMGDMVFFKTGRDTYHVGVMINNEQFMHASTSSGVMISGLQEKYWSDMYLTTRRVF